MDRNFGFNSPAMGAQAPSRSDSSRPARPRVSKKKYTAANRSSVAREDDPSSNPFRPASWNPGQVISGSLGSSSAHEGLGFAANAVSGNKEFVFGAKKDSSESNLNTNSRGNMEDDNKAPIDETRRLKHASEQQQQLNVNKDCREIGDSGVDELLSSQLTKKVENKLSIKSEGNAACTQKFDGIKLNSSGSTKFRRHSLSGENVAFGGVNGTKFLNEIRKLSMKDSVACELKQPAFGGIHSFGRSTENELSDELNNLRIKETMNNLSDDNKKFGVSSSDKSSFVFGGCGNTKMQLNDVSKPNTRRLSGQATKDLPVLSKITTNTKSDILNGKSLSVFSGSIPSEFSFQAVRESKVSSNDQVHVDKQSNTFSTSSSIGVQSVTGVPGSPSLDWPGKNVEFSFNGTPDSAIMHHIEFRTPTLMGSLNRKPETKRDPTKDIRLKKKKGKLKKAISDPLKFGQYHLQENVDFSESYSLMDISPYQETPRENTFSGVTSGISNEVINQNGNSLTDSRPVVSNGTRDKDLTCETEHLDINDNSINDHEEAESWDSISQGSFAEGPCEKSFSGAKTDNFRSAINHLDYSANSLNTAAENRMSSIAPIDKEDSDGSTNTNLEGTCQTGFIFSASSTARVQSSVVTRHQKKKNKTKIGNGSSISTSSSKVSYLCTPVKSFQVCGTSSFLSPPSQGKQGNIPAFSSRSQSRNGSVKEKEVKLGIMSTADVNMAAHETCERWRLR